MTAPRRRPRLLTYLRIYLLIYLLSYLLDYLLITYLSNYSRYIGLGTDPFVAIYSMKPANISIIFISPKKSP